ncbi:MAG TPA: hypothetical protein VF808_10180 [Ktedonobacterales bacterium]
MLTDQPGNEEETAVHAVTPRPITPQAVFETALIVLALAGALFLLPHVIGGDAARRYAALTALLTGKGAGATKYSLLGPIFAAPLWWLGAWVATPQAGVGWFNTLVFGLGLLGLYLVLRRHVEGRLLRAFLLLFTLASMVPYHLTQFYGEVFTASLMAVGLSAAVLSARAGGRLAGWGLAALGVANTPATIVGLAVVAIQRMWARRAARHGLAVVAALALIAATNLLQRGSLTNTGYQTDYGAHSLMPFAGIPGFSYPLLLGLLSVLLSFGKGLVFYAPGLFLPVRKRMRRLIETGLLSSGVWTVYTLWIGFTVGLIVVYSKWWAWYGGWFWGPRFFLFACAPASFALALWTQRPSARLWVNIGALGVLALSTWVGINGAVFGQSGLQVCTAHFYLLESYCHYSPDYSALWRPLVNFYLFGLGPRFIAAEELQPGPVTFGFFILAVAVYLALPLMRTIARQARDLANSQVPRLTARLRGWRL